MTHATNPLAVICPKCGAGIGSKCFWVLVVRGQVKRELHLERRRLARESPP